MVAERAVDILAAALEHNSAAGDKVGSRANTQAHPTSSLVLYIKAQNLPFLQCKAVLYSSGPCWPSRLYVSGGRVSMLFFKFVTCSVELFGAFIELT